MRTDDSSRAGLRRWTIAGIVVVVVGAAAVTVTYTPLFAARDIRLEGVGQIPRGDLLTLAGIEEGSNVFHLNTRMAERSLERDPRILDARVTTSLPDGVLIEIDRRVPVAVVGIPQSFIGADGVVIGPASRPADLPALASADGGAPTGRDLEAAAAAAGAMDPALREVVDAVVVADGGELEVRLGTGFSALLGEATELEAKAASLAVLLEWAADQEVSVVSADLTVPGSPTAQLKRGSASVPVP